MKHEFKKIIAKNETRYVLENASAGATGSSSVASLPTSLGKVRKRSDNILAQEGDKITVPVTQKPRQGPLRPQTGGGAHRDKKKEQKQGKEKHRKPFAEEDVAETKKKPNATTRHLRDYPVSDKDVAKPVQKPEKKKPEQGVAEGGLESDHEISMASNELQSIIGDAKKLLMLVKQYSEMEGLEAWQQSKITKATDYIASVLRSIAGEQDMLEGLRDPKDNPCWKGYKPVGTKKKGGRTVPNCVPKESTELNEYETHTYKDSQGNVWRVNDEGEKELVRAAAGSGSGGRYGSRYPQRTFSKPSGMYFYNVGPGQENDAILAGLRQTKSGKWYSSYQNSKADKTFGAGRYWEPKNETASEDEYMESLGNSLTAALQEKAPPGAKYKRMAKHIKAGYKGSGLDDEEIAQRAFGATWKAAKKAKK